MWLVIVTYESPIISSTVATILTLGNVVDGTGQILLDDLQCTGRESRLIDCPHRGLGIHDCSHNEDAGVRCSPGISTLMMHNYITVVYLKVWHL